jgi:hypothetical protein
VFALLLRCSDFTLILGKPVPLALPRVGRKRHEHTLARIQSSVVNRNAGGVAAPERQPQRIAFGLVASQSGDRNPLAAGSLQAFAQIPVEYGMRADFEKDIEALGLQRRDRGRKLNRSADIVPPICRVEPTPLDCRTGNGRNEAPPAFSWRQPVEPVQ